MQQCFVSSVLRQHIIKHFPDKPGIFQPCSRFSRISLDAQKAQLRIDSAGAERVCNDLACLCAAIQRAQHASLTFQNE